MLENTSRNLRILAGAVGVTLALGVGVSVGAVPQLGDSGPVQAAAVSDAEQVAAPVPPAGNDVPASEQAPTTAATAAPSTTAAKPATTAPPTTKAAAAKTSKPAAAPASAAPTAAAPAAAAPTAAVSTAVPRRTPTTAEVQAAITELKKRVGGVLRYMPISPAQIDQVGDQVCTAFDNGATVTQVKSTALSMIPSSITVTAATTDWAVREAVTLYCPGHLSKLG